LRKEISEGLFIFLDYIGIAKSISAEDSTIFVNKNLVDAKVSSDCTGMLGACSSENIQNMALRVKAP
jgi:hypothetical protein